MVNDNQLLEALADMWSRVGIRARVEVVEMAVRQKMVNERSLPPNALLLINPQSILLDVDGSLWRLLHPTGLNGKNWVGSQPGQRFHDVMESARYALDPRKRRELYTEATRIVHEDKLELFQEVVIYGVGKRVCSSRQRTIGCWRRR
jgi:ABC-type transport system substrate-binding protein